MTSSEGPDSLSTVSPEEAFAVLGDETRLEILTVMAEAGEKLEYSELFDRVDYEDSANFTYHLDRLRGHFLRKTSDGYALRIPGERVVQAMHSGVLTEHVTIERTEIDFPCVYCGGPTEVAYHDELAVLYCLECEGRGTVPELPKDWPISTEGIVGHVSVPPAGVYERSVAEIVEAAGIWTVTDIQAHTRGVCPRCAAPVDRSVRVCAEHELEGKFCQECESQFAVYVDAACENCTFESTAPYPTHALGEVPLIDFMTDHGVDPFVSEAFHLTACEETLIRTRPLKAEYTFRLNGDAITLTIDEELTVTGVSRHPGDGSESARDGASE